MLSLCLATSLDGKLNSESERGLPRFTSRADRDRLFRLRAEADLLFVGAETVRRENLPPLVRNPDYAALRPERSPHPAVAVWTRSQDLPFEGAYFGAKDQAVFVVTAHPRRMTRQRCRDRGIEIIEIGEAGMGGVVEDFRRRGYHRILAEGGGHLAHALLAADLVEELHLTLAPWVFAGQTNPSLAEGPAFDPPRRWVLEELRRVDDEVHLRYVRVLSPTTEP